jgi:hypothetical protein
MKTRLLISLALAFMFTAVTSAQKIYRSGGGEIIFSSADVTLLPSGSDPVTDLPVDLNTNVRFTLFLHIQQFLNVDLTQRIGLFTGVTLRNVGLITEDLYQYHGFANVDNSHDNWNKNTKMKRRSYSLGFPLALKIGNLGKHYFIYAGGEYEWMFHYKQKQFIDGTKSKFTEWGSDRVNPWIPSVFAGIQFPGGMNLKFKYYLDDFINTGFTGRDFGQDVDYSQYQSSGIWYISLALILNKKQLQDMVENPGFDRSAYNY